MTSSEKMDILLDMDRRKVKAIITTISGETYYCKPLHFAEDGDEWAYEFFSPDAPTKYFAMPCDFIERIEELSEDEWREHLAAVGQ